MCFLRQKCVFWDKNYLLELYPSYSKSTSCLSIIFFLAYFWIYSQSCFMQYFMIKWIKSVITLDLLYFKYYFYDLLAHPWLPFIKISHEMIVEKNNQLSVHTKRGDCFKKGLCRGGMKLWYLYGTVYTCTCTGTYWYQNPWYQYHFIYIIIFSLFSYIYVHQIHIL